MKKELFRGSGVAIITPFKNGQVDYEGLKKAIDFQITNGTQAIIACGTTGESATLSDEEKKDVYKCAIEHVNHRVPVIAGTGSNNTAHAVELSEYAQGVGADGLLVVSPYYNKTTQKGLCEHYLKIAGSTDLPVIVYNVPSRTGLNILPDTYAKLAEHKNINSIKEANSNIGALAQTFAKTNGNINVYCGNDDEIVPFLSLGSIGVISVLANVAPRQTQDICELYFKGEQAKSAALQISLIELCNALFCETNPIPVKYGMSLLGICGEELRLPLVEMEPANKAKLEAAMKKAGLI